MYALQQYDIHYIRLAVEIYTTGHTLTYNQVKFLSFFFKAFTLEFSLYAKTGGYIYLQQSYLKACKATGKKVLGLVGIQVTRT